MKNGYSGTLISSATMRVHHGFGIAADDGPQAIGDGDERDATCRVTKVVARQPWSWSTFSDRDRRVDVRHDDEDDREIDDAIELPASVGDMVANSTSVISAETMMRPTPGTPWRLMRAKICGNMPSSAAALPDWPTSSIQPPSDPTDFSTAQTLMIDRAPGADREARGFGERRVRGAQLLVRQHAHDDRGAQHVDDGGRRPRPMSVASGTLRLGFSMTPADTVALSMPM